MSLAMPEVLSQQEINQRVRTSILLKITKKIKPQSSEDANPEIKAYTTFLISYSKILKNELEILIKPIIKKYRLYQKTLNLSSQPNKKNKYKTLLKKSLNKLTEIERAGIKNDSLSFNVSEISKKLQRDLSTAILKKMSKKKQREFLNTLTNTIINKSNKKFSNKIKTLTTLSKKIELGSSLENEDIFENFLVRKMNPLRKIAIETNIDLISSIDISTNLDKILRRGVFENLSYVELQHKIISASDAIKSQAERIARDQILSFHADVVREQAGIVGAEKYIWRNMRDGRVRTTHKKLEGKTYSFNNPPVSESNGDRNNPGGGVQCRCYAEVLFDFLF